MPTYSFANEYNCNSLNGNWFGKMLTHGYVKNGSSNLEIENGKFHLHINRSSKREADDSWSINGKLLCDISDNVGRLYNYNYTGPTFIIYKDENIFMCDSITYNNSCTKFEKVEN